MEHDFLLLRYGEIFLKGKNRGLFERKLVDNVKKITGKKSTKLRGRLLMEYFSEHSSLKRVFGLVSYSPAIKVDGSLEEIEKAALNVLSGKKGTFRIQTKRSDKRFPLTSPEINQRIGSFIEKHTSLSFSLKNSDIILYIEINQEGIYLFTEVISCFGGLPTGIGGKVFLLLEDESSLLAGLLMMKRGTSIIPIAYGEKDISLLQKYSPVDLELKIIKNLNEFDENISILVSGQNFEKYEEYETNLLVLRPLISMDANDINLSLGGLISEKYAG
mgnify:CR=1 FL=1|jgi:tRNA uracil 4-sulfurtransferase